MRVGGYERSLAAFGRAFELTRAYGHRAASAANLPAREHSRGPSLRHHVASWSAASLAAAEALQVTFGLARLDAQYARSLAASGRAYGLRLNITGSASASIFRVPHVLATNLRHAHRCDAHRGGQDRRPHATSQQMGPVRPLGLGSRLKAARLSTSCPGALPACADSTPRA
jgi:hypothetical protein